MTVAGRSVLDVVDAATEEAVLVFGSLPPEGRDLDLLARPGAAASLGAALSREGFIRAGSSWVSFRRCSAEMVEVVPASSWALRPAVLDELFAGAVPLPGRANVVRPAPHDALLILARRAVGVAGHLEGKLRAKVDTALGEDSDAWATARSRAPAWGLVRALGILENAYRFHEELPRPARARAMAELLRAQGAALPTAYARACRQVLTPRRRRGMVVAVSGLSGAGASAQAASLRKTLDRLGVETAAGGAGALDDSTRDVVVGSRVGGQLSAAGLAWQDGIAHRRATRRHLRAGRVVVCDRYTLDSAVHLRQRYGAIGTMRFQAWLVRSLAPRPIRAYFLDVSPTVAARRKSFGCDVADLDRDARLYREEAARMGVDRLDGERPEEDLCREIARDVWLSTA